MITQKNVIASSQRLYYQFVLHTNTSKIAICYESYKTVTIISHRNIFALKPYHTGIVLLLKFETI